MTQASFLTEAQLGGFTFDGIWSAAASTIDAIEPATGSAIARSGWRTRR